MSRLPVVGLVPAAGRAVRLGPLPGSKELLPTGLRDGPAGPVLDVACRHLLERFHRAGIDRAVFVLRDEKLDIPRYLCRHLDLPLDLAYVVLPASGSVPESLDRAYPFLRDDLVALGFPDIVFEPGDAFLRLIARREETAADVVLGLFPRDDPSTTDMVALGEGGRLLRVEARPRRSDLTHNWLLALWGPRFTEFLHQSLRREPPGLPPRDGRDREELQLGLLFEEAAAAGLDVRGVEIEGGSYLDLGTPGDYLRYLRQGL